MRKMQYKDGWTLEEFTKYFYQPDRSDPDARIVAFNVTMDFGGFTRKAKLCKNGDVNIEDAAKAGKCLAVEQGTKQATRPTTEASEVKEEGN